MKLSARQKEALDLLRQADMTIVMLAERMGLHRYTAGRIVRELKQAGLVCWRGSAKREGRGARPAVFGVYRAEEAKKRSSSSVVCVKARSAELASALDLPAGDSIIGVGWDFERRVAMFWIERRVE